MKAEENILLIINHMLHMLFTIYYKVVYALVCAILAEKRPLTPPDMQVEGYKKNVGEAGWWWELRYLKGIVKVF